MMISYAPVLKWAPKPADQPMYSAHPMAAKPTIYLARNTRELCRRAQSCPKPNAEISNSPQQPTFHRAKQEATVVTYVRTS
jgi:hypothetical protein